LPDRLGPFLSALVERRPGVCVRVLQWNLGLIGTLVRGTTPLFLLNWMASKCFQFRLDGAHPPGAAHHQKIVVIDDALAFCGGIDMTDDRWDTRDHKDEDPRRVRPSGPTLVPIEMPPSESRPLDDGELLDPEQAEPVWLMLSHALKDRLARAAKR